MRKSILFMIFLLPVLLFSQTDGTWTTNADVVSMTQGKVVKFTFALDSAGTLTSDSWDVSEFDDFLYATYTIQGAYKFTSSDSLPKITGVIQGSMDDVNFVLVDTMFSDAASEVMVFFNSDMSSIHAPYLRISLTGIELGAADQQGWIHLYHYSKRDEY